MSVSKRTDRISDNLRVSPSKLLFKGNFPKPEKCYQREEDIRSDMFISFNNRSYPVKATEICRVQSHSTSRIINTKQGVIREKWTKICREGRELGKNAEIVKLNSKIQSLIRENSVLKGKVQRHSACCKIGENENDGFEKEKKSGMEVTFRPQEPWDSPVKVPRKFPRHIFSIPKFTGPKY